MNDPQSTPEPPVDCAAFDQKQREYARRAEEFLAANKVVLFDSLAAAGIETVTVIFDGYGDSGQIERIDVEPGEGTILLPSDRIEIARTAWGSPEIERQTLTVHEAIETLVYDFLRQVHSGWEINDGAYGHFIFDVAERTIKLGTTSGTPRPKISLTNFEEATMGHPYHHALSSVRKWGGAADDYLPLHQWFDESKAITADFRHRALRHHAEGIFMLERFFGATITISTGRVVPVRLIGEQHVIEDLGFIPSFADWVRCIRPVPWMGRAQPIHRQVDPFASAT